jgi:hypothetical protein
MGYADRRDGAAADRDSLVGVPWYTADSYRAILEVMDDAGLFPDSYAAWHRGAEECVRSLRLAGRIPVPVRIEPQEFLRWCAEENVRSDAEARMDYARAMIAGRQEVVTRDSLVTQTYIGQPIPEVHFSDVSSPVIDLR